MKNIPLFCAFSFFLIAPGAYILTEHLALVMNGEQYQGKITGYKHRAVELGQEKMFRYPMVEFIDKDKQKRVLSTMNMEFYFKEYSRDENVRVYYDPSTGKLIINDIYSLWSQPLFLIALGGLICYFGRNLKLK